MSGVCGVPLCTRDVLAKGLCPAHYFRQRRTGSVRAEIPIRSPKYREHLPAGYYADVPVDGAGFFGSVITCETCADQLGPVWSAAAAAMTIHAHQLRAHGETGRHLE